jgi:hypothetical protein
MDKLAMVQDAWKELGEVPAQELSAFIHKKFGVIIEAKFIPLFKASLRDRSLLENLRQQRRAASPPPAPDPVPTA